MHRRTRSGQKADVQAHPDVPDTSRRDIHRTLVPILKASISRLPVAHPLP